MKITRDYYQLLIKNQNHSNYRFISFSDLHYSLLQQLFYQGKMNRFFETIIKKEKNIDGILIPGDLLSYLSKYPNKKIVEALKWDLENLSYQLRTQIFISYGNHDFPLMKEKELEEEKWNLKYFLEDRKNGIYVLDNEQIVKDSLTITGYSPKREAYNTTYMPTKALQMSFQEFQTHNFPFDKNHVNILLSHENKFFSYPEAIKEYKDLYQYLTLIVGGHLHDGYIPIGMQKMFEKQLKDYGIWEKYPPKIDMCRGLFKVSKNGLSQVILPSENSQIILEKEETASIINRGVAKYSWVIYGRPSYTMIEIIEEKEKKNQITDEKKRKKMKDI